jgi:hypothetical protein
MANLVDWLAGKNLPPLEVNSLAERYDEKCLCPRMVDTSGGFLND